MEDVTKTLDQDAADTVKEICNMAKKGYTPSQIGVVLRCAATV